MRLVLRRTAAVMLTWLMLLAMHACGGSTTAVPDTPAPGPAPTTPSPAPAALANVAGNWSGTLEAPGFATRNLTMVVFQGGNCVDGAWRTTSTEWSGSVSGFAGAGSFSGELTLQGPGGCGGVGTFSGEVTASTIRWTSSGFSGGCPGGLPQNATLSLRRD